MSKYTSKSNLFEAKRDVFDRIATKLRADFAANHTCYAPQLGDMSMEITKTDTRQEKVVAMLPPSQRADFKSRLTFYKEGKPYREPLAGENFRRFLYLLR